MKKLFKVLFLIFLCQQAFAQSKMDMRANDIVINRPLRIEHSINSNSFALYVKSPENSVSNFSFLEGNTFVGLISREDNRFRFFFEGGVDFNFGFPFITTAITATGIITDGSLQSKDLSFTTTNNAQIKPVFADKDGKLIVDNILTNHYQSYNFTAVQAQDYDDQLRKGSGFAWFNTTTAPATMYLPVNLPDGVKITSVEMKYVDNSASSIDFIMYANSNNTNTFTTISSGSSILASSSIRTSATAASTVVDNSANSYYVNISSGGNWTGNTLQFHSLVITYQYQ